MRRSSSSSAEEVDAEDDFPWGMEAALCPCLEAVSDLETVFDLEARTGVSVFEDGAEQEAGLVAFLAVEGFCGSIVEVSAIVFES